MTSRVAAGLGTRSMIAGGGPWSRPSWAGRYEMLDALRGLAAVTVVAHHLGYGVTANLGHYAVIVFFVISGYCISASADSAVKRGLGFRAYMWRRIRRIYPPYLAALAFFVATRVIKAAVGAGWSTGDTPSFWLQNGTLTQWLSLLVHPQSWAADNKALAVAAFWSLGYEEQFYLVMGLIIASGAASLRALVWWMVALLLVGLAWNVALPSISFGVFIEYWVEFGIGCLLYLRLCRAREARSRRAVDLFLALVAAASVYATWFSGRAWESGVRIAYLEWLVAAVFAGALVVLRPFSDAFAASRVGRWLMNLGLVTYSLYLVHQFNLSASRWVAVTILPGWAPEVMRAVTQGAFLLSVAGVFWYAFERPFLNPALSTRNSASAPLPGQVSEP